MIKKNMIKKNISLFKVNIPKNISVDKILHSNFIGQGKYVDIFEEKFANHFGMDGKNILSLNSCTSAIALALILSNVKYGDDIVTSPYTCLATNSEIKRMGANVVWYDIDKKTGLASLEEIKKAITKRTKVVIIAHLSGMICGELKEILNYCHSYNIKVIEDAAQSLGAKYKEKYFCEKSDFICYSFQAIKQLTTIDGGMLYCKKVKDVKRGKLLRWFGLDRTLSSEFRCSQNIEEIGMKIHMTDIPAYIGIKSLNTIDKIIKTHIKNAKLYEKLFKTLDEITVCHSSETGSSFWVYPIQVENRNGLKEFLFKNKIDSSLVQNRLDDKICFKDSYKELPNLEYFIKRILHIPCGWWVSKKEIYYIFDKISEFYS